MECSKLGRCQQPRNDANHHLFPDCAVAGQYNDAAYSLVQLRKILEDSANQPGGKEVLQGAELAALQSACASCEASLEEVRGENRHRDAYIHADSNR